MYDIKHPCQSHSHHVAATEVKAIAWKWTKLFLSAFLFDLNNNVLHLSSLTYLLNEMSQYISWLMSNQ